MCVCVCVCARRWKREDIDDLRRYAISCGKASSPIGPGYGDEGDQEQEQEQVEGEREGEAVTDSQHVKHSGIVTGTDNDDTLRPFLSTTDSKATDNTTLPPLVPSITFSAPPSSSVSVVVKGVECSPEGTGPLLQCTPVTVYGTYAPLSPPSDKTSSTSASTSASASASVTTMQSAFANFYSSSLTAVQTVGQTTGSLVDWSLTAKAAGCSKVCNPFLALRTARASTYSTYSTYYLLLNALTYFAHHRTTYLPTYLCS